MRATKKFGDDSRLKELGRKAYVRIKIGGIMLFAGIGGILLSLPALHSHAARGETLPLFKMVAVAILLAAVAGGILLVLSGGRHLVATFERLEKLSS